MLLLLERRKNGAIQENNPENNLQKIESWVSACFRVKSQFSDELSYFRIVCNHCPWSLEFRGCFHVKDQWVWGTLICKCLFCHCAALQCSSFPCVLIWLHYSTQALFPIPEPPAKFSSCWFGDWFFFSCKYLWTVRMWILLFALEQAAGKADQGVWFPPSPPFLQFELSTDIGRSNEHQEEWRASSAEF